jgi:peptide/nickel transport system ATP-binding protein
MEMVAHLHDGLPRQQHPLDRAVTPLLSIRDLHVGFARGARPPQAVLRGVSLQLDRGQALGIVGESGCGKSVTWLASLGLLGPHAQVSGQVLLDGQDIVGWTGRQLAAVRGRRIAMIFQDPASSLNPVHRIGTQLMESLALHRGLRGAAGRAEALRLLDRVRLPAAVQRLGAYPHELSGGMNQRVMIAMALAGEPDVLVADEPTTSLDVTIQAQILALLDELRRDSGLALALISHDLGVIAEVCDRVLVMYAGRVVEQADTAALFASPGHPYTQGLLAALPDVTGPRRPLQAIPGQVPEAGQAGTGCAFHPRCAHAVPTCRAHDPAWHEPVPGHHVACVQVQPRWREAA